MSCNSCADGLDASQQKVSVQSLPSQHRMMLVRAVLNVLSTSIAEITFAQILDGAPLSEVEMDSYGGTLSHLHPIHTRHTELHPDTLQKTRQFRNEFDGSQLEFHSSLSHNFEIASPGSRAFRTRLIEMVAVAVHQIAVQLFNWQKDQKPHDSHSFASWTPPKDEFTWWECFPDGPPPTLFRHAWYLDYDQYPEHVADGVGYWAESRILGGVVLFDRRDPGSSPEVDPHAIYYHSDRDEVTYRIYELLDHQVQQLAALLLSEESPPTSCPIPILGDSDNYPRVDPEEDIESTGIYRDRWERKPIGPEAYDQRLRDVRDWLNWPRDSDWTESRSRASERRLRINFGEK